MNLAEFETEEWRAAFRLIYPEVTACRSFRLTAQDVAERWAKFTREMRERVLH